MVYQKRLSILLIFSILLAFVVIPLNQSAAKSADNDLKELKVEQGEKDQGMQLEASFLEDSSKQRHNIIVNNTDNARIVEHYISDKMVSKATYYKNKRNSLCVDHTGPLDK